MAILINKEQVALALGNPLGQGHGFGCGSGFVQQRGAGQLHAGQVDGQLLEVQQRLQATLGNLRLIRGVGGVPARVFQHIAQDHGRRQRAVVTHADAGGEDLVAAGNLLQIVQHLGLAARAVQRQQISAQNALRHGLGNQRFQRGGAQGRQHGLLLCGVRADVTTNEGVGLFQLDEARGVAHGVYLCKV